MDNVSNFIFGGISILAIISGFIVKDYQVLFWTIGVVLLVVVILGQYVFDHENRINYLLKKLKIIEESLNTHERLNKLELKVFKK